MDRFTSTPKRYARAFLGQRIRQQCHLTSNTKIAWEGGTDRRPTDWGEPVPVERCSWIAGGSRRARGCRQDLEAGGDALPQRSDPPFWDFSQIGQKARRRGCSGSTAGSTGGPLDSTGELRHILIVHVVGPSLGQIESIET